MSSINSDDLSEKLSVIGFKYCYNDEKIKVYQKFGKNTITLKISDNEGREDNHVQYSIEHDREWPTEDLIRTKQQEMTNGPFENIVENVIETIVGIVVWLEESFKEEDEVEFKDDNNETTDDTTKDIILPKIQHNSKRELKIVVWGRQIRKAVPDTYKIEKNFNAAVLHGKKKGVNWREDARDDEVRTAVMKGKCFAPFMEEMIKSIESNNLHRISINCAKGRHRSVSCAIALKQYYYPKSDITFLEL